MTQFHSPEYVDFLRRVAPDNARDFAQAMQECKFLNEKALAIVLSLLPSQSN
jgi:hypothetical protein